MHNKTLTKMHNDLHKLQAFMDSRGHNVDTQIERIQHAIQVVMLERAGIYKLPRSRKRRVAETNRKVRAYNVERGYKATE